MTLVKISLYCIHKWIDIVTTKEDARQMNAEERLVLKRLRKIFKTKVHDDIPSFKNVDWKKTKREVCVTTNVKTSSE